MRKSVQLENHVIKRNRAGLNHLRGNLDLLCAHDRFSIGAARVKI
jgi:hypothetical protein